MVDEKDMAGESKVLRPPAEVLYAQELSALQANDDDTRPPGWHLSPRAVRTFILGSKGKKLAHKFNGAKVQTEITQKFYGDDALVERCIVTLAGVRGLMLIGEPGTAKTMLSELLTAAISGDSTNTVQGTAGTTEDQVKYSWNYALLLSEGPSERSLVPSAIYKGLTRGSIVRFEEITRCPIEVQDTLVSIMSDKILHVPEMEGEGSSVLARKGFNVVATANLRDRGVHDMSSALKRRFNFETVHPIGDRGLETKLVKEQTERLLADLDVKVDVNLDVVNLLVTTFHDMREGVTEDGVALQKPTAIMSTAEAVSVGVSAGLDAAYFGKRSMLPDHLTRNMVGTVLKDNPEDEKRLREYFDVVVKDRSQRDRLWAEYYKARKWLR